MQGEFEVKEEHKIEIKLDENLEKAISEVKDNFVQISQLLQENINIFVTAIEKSLKSSGK